MPCVRGDRRGRGGRRMKVLQAKRDWQFIEGVDAPVTRRKVFLDGDSLRRVGQVLGAVQASVEDVVDSEHLACSEDPQRPSVEFATKGFCFADFTPHNMPKGHFARRRSPSSQPFASSYTELTSKEVQSRLLAIDDPNQATFIPTRPDTGKDDDPLSQNSQTFIGRILVALREGGYVTGAANHGRRVFRYTGDAKHMGLVDGADVSFVLVRDAGGEMLAANVRELKPQEAEEDGAGEVHQQQHHHHHHHQPQQQQEAEPTPSPSPPDTPAPSPSPSLRRLPHHETSPADSAGSQSLSTKDIPRSLYGLLLCRQRLSNGDRRYLLRDCLLKADLGSLSVPVAATLKQPAYGKLHPLHPATPLPSNLPPCLVQSGGGGGGGVRWGGGVKMASPRPHSARRHHSEPRTSRVQRDDVSSTDDALGQVSSLEGLFHEFLPGVPPPTA